MERERAQKELEEIKSGKITDVRKINLIKKKKFSDEYDPSSPLNPWYSQPYQEKLYDILDFYKYPL